jgi:hypothetical protein
MTSPARSAAQLDADPEARTIAFLRERREIEWALELSSDRRVICRATMCLTLS